MADEQADDSQADDASKSQVDDKQDDKSKDTEDKSQADADRSQADERISKEEAKKLKSEAQSLRKRLHQLEEAQKKAENEKLSETERLKKEKAELEKSYADLSAKVTESDRREAFLSAASDEKRQIRNPRALYRFVKDDIEFEDSEIKNLDSLLKRAKLEAPELFGARSNGSADGGTGSQNGAQGGDMNRLIRQATGRV